MTTDYTKSLSPAMLDSIGRFVISLQAEDGYFYHPQWGNGVTLGRKSRDLMWSETILRNLGLQPIYDTPNGMKGTGLPSEVALVSTLKARSVATAVAAVAAVSTSSDPNLQDDVSFKAYLEALDVKNNSYAAGNTLAAYYNTIRSRDYQLQREGVDYSLIDIMIEHLNDAQNQADGSWYYVSKDAPSYSEYYAVNGIMKISCVYDSAGVMMPNSDKALQKAIDAIVSSQEVAECVDVYNTWFTISNIFSILKKCGGSEGASIVSQTRAMGMDSSNTITSYPEKSTPRTVATVDNATPQATSSPVRQSCRKLITPSDLNGTIFKCLSMLIFRKGFPAGFPHRSNCVFNLRR